MKKWAVFSYSYRLQLALLIARNVAVLVWIVKHRIKEENNLQIHFQGLSQEHSYRGQVRLVRI